MTLYGEGSNASSTSKESDLSQSSGERITHSSEWEGTQMLRWERHAHRWPSKMRGAMLALPTRSSGELRTHFSEWEGTQTPRSEWHAHRWPSMVRGAMLALPTMLRRERHAHRWPSKVRGAMLALPTMLRRERHAHRGPSMVRGAMLALPLCAGDLMTKEALTETYDLAVWSRGNHCDSLRNGSYSPIGSCAWDHSWS